MEGTLNDDPANTTARGYGAAHQKLRAQVAQLVAAGTAVCWRCGRAIQPWMAWDLGHDDYDRSVYRGPEHAKCNRSSGRTERQPHARQRAKVRRRVLNVAASGSTRIADPFFANTGNLTPRVTPRSLSPRGG